MASVVGLETDLPKVEDVWKGLTFWEKFFVLVGGQIKIGSYKGPGHPGFSEFFIFMCFGCKRILLSHGQGYDRQLRCHYCEEKLRSKPKTK